MALWTLGPRLLDDSAEFTALADGLRKGVRETVVHGLTGPAAAYVLAGLWQVLERPLCVVAPGWGEAEAAAQSLGAWIGPERVLMLPPRDFLPYAVVAHSPELAADRLRALEALATWSLPEPPVLVLPVASLRRVLPPADVFRSAVVELEMGDDGDPRDLARRLADAGYRGESLVEGPGTFSLRGGIVDVFPLTHEQPVRVEFSDDVVESLRTFSPETQRSTGEIEACRLAPAREVPAPRGEALEEALARLRRECDDAASRLAGEARARIEDRAAEAEEALARGDGWESFLPYAYDPVLPTQYLPGRPCVVVLEAARAAEALRDAATAERERFASLLADGRLLPAQASNFAIEPLWPGSVGAGSGPAGRAPLVHVTTLPCQIPGTSPDEVLGFSSRPIPAFQGQWHLVADESRRWREGGYSILCAAGGEERTARLVRELEEAGLTARADGPLAPGVARVAPETLPAGFEFPGLRLAVVADSDLLGRRPKQRRPRRPSGGVRLQSYEDLEVGDYVVHVQHGIGQYLGTSTLEVAGARRDYLLIRYEGADRLYVPTDQIAVIQKYIGGEGHHPRVNRLGSGDWARTKQRVKESVRQMADELLQLYAARQSVEGHTFPADSPWQGDFEDAFPFEETADQLQAAAEIKRDMERSQPMDRLLCGDVGFGKTEVVLRAAFKAVVDGRQVAVLVPTTILAEQHYLTFRERFRGFPVNVGMLSRFRTRKEQEETITGLMRGEVDVVVGTHRLLQADVGFKDLGLLIIDEEHRFGVAHKERLKQLRSTVDAVTLTATPIPRTLHMAMAGLRDMSVIETPPEDRFPVETYVVEWSEALCRDAVEREMHRGGQVYYLHNRVQSIGRAYERLKRLVPQADIVVAHGQMDEERLERIMVEFWRGEHDVLLCTSIIESGLDIANANTLIVEDSDRLGLAQLYQLRGRVGRSSRLAYAYFTYRPARTLSEAASKRLEAIKQFTELGSGFKIALRDLEIRGAGNLLGPEQHGFVAAIGFDLYAQLLEEAVREARGERVVPSTRTSVELRVDGYIDSSYLADPRAKLDVYKRVNGAAAPGDVDAVEEELLDRFGPFPAAVANLLRLARLRLTAQDLGLLSLTQEGPRLVLVFPGYLAAVASHAAELAPRFGRRLRVQARPRPTVTLALEHAGERGVLEAAEGLLQAIHQLPAVRRWRETVQV